MTNAIIGYENKFEDGTVTASSDPAATPKENAYDWLLSDYWEPAAATSNYIEVDLGTAQSVDFFGFYSNNFHAEAGAQIVVKSGAAPAPTTARATVSITTSGPKLITFASVSARYWRIDFNTTGSFSVKVAAAAIGVRLELEKELRPGYSPPALGQNNMPVSNVSETGIFLGRSIERAPISFNVALTILTEAWIRANWPALLAHIEKYPFFIWPEPDTDTAGAEVVIAWTDGQIRPPEYSHAAHLSLNLPLKAFK